MQRPTSLAAHEKKWKRVFALLAMLICERRKTVEMHGRVACHADKRPRKERWKREFGLLPMPTGEATDKRPRKERWKREFGLLPMPTWEAKTNYGNESLGCMPSRRAAQEGMMETDVRTVCRADKRSREERWTRMCGVLVTPTGGPGKKDGNARSRCSPC